MDDFIAYEEAAGIYSRLVDGGRHELAAELATLYMDKAFVHENVDDVPGALTMYDRALEIHERLVHQEGRRELAEDLAWTQLYWADVAQKDGRDREAREVAREAIATLQAEIQRTGRADLTSVLPWAQANMAELIR